MPGSTGTQVFLLNPDAASERRQHMSTQLRAHGLAARRIGIDCRKLTRQQTSACVERRFPDVEFSFDLLSGVEIGCWISHLSAWTAFLSSGSGSACVVIEDDVVLEPGFARTIDAIAEQESYDVIHLGTASKNLSARPTSVNGVWVREPVGSICSTWGYVVERRYLQRLFAVRPLQLSLPVDHVLGGRSAGVKHRVAVAQPMVVREERWLGSFTPAGCSGRRGDLIDTTAARDGGRRRFAR